MKILTIMFAESAVIPYTLQKQGHDVLYVAPMKQYADFDQYPEISERIFYGDGAIDLAVTRWGATPDMVLVLSPSGKVAPYLTAAKKICPDAKFLGPSHPEIAELETNRDFFKAVCKKYGVRVPQSVTAPMSRVREFAFWTEGLSAFPVMVKPLTYSEAIDSDEKYLVAKVRSPEEMVTVLDIFKQMAPDFPNPQILIEQFITGFEISCGAFFNGQDFVGPWQHHIEYKTFAAGDVGPNIDEPGVHVVRIDDPSRDVLVPEVKKLIPFLRETGYVGYFDINFIVEEVKPIPTFGSDGEYHEPIKGSITAYAIEPDCRFPVPATSGMLAQTDLVSILMKLASGESDLGWTPTKHVLAAGALHIGFPFCGGMPDQFHYKHVYGLHASKKAFNHDTGGFDTNSQEYYIKTRTGYMFSFVGFGDTVEEAQRDLRITFDSIKYPYMYYRADIGARPLPDWARKGYK